MLFRNAVGDGRDNEPDDVLPSFPNRPNSAGALAVAPSKAWGNRMKLLGSRRRVILA